MASIRRFSTSSPTSSTTALALLVSVLVSSCDLGVGLLLARPPQVSPFSGIRWPEGPGDVVEVEVRGRWYRLNAIDGLSTPELLRACRELYGGGGARPLWVKRFEEDLVVVLSRLGRPPLGASVDLALADPESGRTIVLRDVEMTAENRAGIWRAANASRLRNRGPRAPVALSREQALETLRELRSLLESRSSYAARPGIDLDAAFRQARAGLGELVSRNDFAIKVMKVLATIGDGHAGVRDWSSHLPRGALPFLPVELDGRVAALLPDRSGPVDPEHPFVASIDGVAIDAWLEAAGSIVANGSKQLRRRRAIRNLRYAEFVRRELGIESRPGLRVELASREGESRDLDMPLAGHRALYGEWPRTRSRTLDGDIGYLRLPAMRDDEDFLDGIDRSMREFRETRGLVIDVRGNGGGSRHALRRLLPYLLDESAHRAVNVAAYRLPPGTPRGAPRGYLESRFLHPLDSDALTPAARRVAKRALAAFRPEWTPPPDAFSRWHVMVASRDDNPRAYRYERPVVVLMDSDSFSATDIFLGAFKGLADVTLVGTPSGGGSGRSRSYELPGDIDIRLSSMASFRPSGRPYDGHGVEPDVLVSEELGSHTGDSDPVLARALELLRASSR